MGLVDDGVGKREPQRPVSLPVEAPSIDDRLGDRRRVVLVVELEVVVVVAVAGHIRQDVAVVLKSTRPSIALAYGSIRSFAGLNRWPALGS